MKTLDISDLLLVCIFFGLVVVEVGKVCQEEVALRDVLGRVI